MSRLTLNLQDRWRRPVDVDVIIRLDTVELWCKQRAVGTVDRDLLREWLREPSGTIAYDDTAWLAVGYGVALGIDDMVPAWPLADHLVDYLRQYI